MPRFSLTQAANDNGEGLQIWVEGLDSLALSVAEVEIFDALISNIADLTAANDNERRPAKENAP